MMKKALIVAVAVAAIAGAAHALDAPRKTVAVQDFGWRTDFHPLRNTTSFYDVTNVGDANYDFSDSRMFTAWIGYEKTLSFNKEEIQAMTVNPANGMTYILTYDSGTGGVVDANAGPSGDTDGDWDLWQVDYQALLNDWTTNQASDPNVMYLPSTGGDGVDYQTNMVTHPSASGSSIKTVYSSAITKIGELARNGDQTNGNYGSGDYYDNDLDFVDPATLLVLDDVDNPEDSFYADPNNPTQSERITAAQSDHRVVALKRESTTSGSATHTGAQVTDREGGYNAGTSQSWETKDLGLVNMDGFVNDPNDANVYNPSYADYEYVPTGHTEAYEMQYVKRSAEGGDANGPGGTDTVHGVWLADGDTPVVSGDDADFKAIEAFDGGGDDLTYLGGFRVDQVEDANDNNGELDWIKVDENGGIIWGESGYFDGADANKFGDEDNFGTHEPKVLTRGVLDYRYKGDPNGDFLWMVPADANEDGQELYGPIADPSDDDDDQITDGRFVTIDNGENEIYFFDIDGSPDFKTDLYVYDLDTETFVHTELDAGGAYQGGVDGGIFMEEHGLEFFLRGDVDGDGFIYRGSEGDIGKLQAMIDDPNAFDAVEREAWDLTGDGDITDADLIELIVEISGLEADISLDGQVNLTDLTTLGGNFGQSTSNGLTDGDTNGDGIVNLTDLTTLGGQFGVSIDEAPAGGAGVPEPATVALLAMGGAALLRRRRR